KIVDALRSGDAVEPSHAQAASINGANVGDHADFVELTCTSAIENDDTARCFEFGFARGSCGEIVAVFVVLKAAGSAAAVVIPVAISIAADDSIVVNGGNGVAEPLWIGGSLCPARKFAGERAGGRARFHFGIDEGRHFRCYLHEKCGAF